MVKLTIDGKEILANENTTILQAAEALESNSDPMLP